MPEAAQIKSVQLGDPGAGFELYLNNPVPEGKSLWVILTITDADDKMHSSSLIMHGPIDESPIIIVMPYGCVHYLPGARLDIELVVKLVHTEDGKEIQEEIGTYTGNKLSQDGEFGFKIKRSFLAPLSTNNPTADDIRSSNKRGSIILTGEALHSPNGRYRCRLEYDGRMAIYDLYDAKAGIPVYETEPRFSNASKGKYFAVVSQNCSLQIYGDNNVGTLGVTWSSQNEATKKNINYPSIPGYLKLTDEGDLLFLNGNYPGESDDKLLFNLKELMLQPARD